MNRESKPGIAWGRHLLGGSVTALCLIILLTQVDIDEVAAALAGFHWPYLVPAVVSLAAGYLLRILRWSVMLNVTTSPATFGNCVTPFLGSIALNNILPLRLGDLVRALVFPRAMGVTRTVATSSLIMERLIDLVTLLICFAIGLAMVQAVNIPAWLEQSVLSLSLLAGVVLVFCFLFSGRLARLLVRLSDTDRAKSLGGLLRHAGNLMHSFEAMSRPRVFFSVFLLSMLVWAGESGLYYFVLLGFGLDVVPVVALLVMSIATLSTLVPSSPGYIGPFHLAAFTAISVVGGTSAQAGGYAVLSHLSLWVPTTIAGAIAIWMRPALFRMAKSEQSRL